MSRSVNMSPAFSAPYGIKVRYQSKYITAFFMSKYNVSGFQDSCNLIKLCRH